MEASLKNLILLGIGTIAYSYDKADSIIDSLIRKGEITVKQGMELNDELKRNMDGAKTSGEAKSLLTPEMLKEVLLNLNLATRQDIDELKERISKLEKK